MRVNYRNTIETDAERREREERDKEERKARLMEMNQNMGMKTMGKVSGEMGGAGVIVGGEQAPANADLAGTGMISGAEKAGGAEGLLGGDLGMDMKSAGSTVGSIGSVIKASDDKQQAETTRLAQDDSMRQANQARLREAQASNVDAQALLDKARRYGRGS
jgi:hypothetical protein